MRQSVRLGSVKERELDVRFSGMLAQIGTLLVTYYQFAKSGIQLVTYCHFTHSHS